MSLNEAKSWHFQAAAAVTFSLYISLFCILRLHYGQSHPSTRCITGEHVHHSRGQEHLWQLSPSCSCWRLSRSITLRASLLAFVLAHIKGEGISLFSLGSLLWMTPSGPTSPRKAEEEAANGDNARLVCEAALPPPEDLLFILTWPVEKYLLLRHSSNEHLV